MKSNGNFIWQVYHNYEAVYESYQRISLKNGHNFPNFPVFFYTYIAHPTMDEMIS